MAFSYRTTVYRRNLQAQFQSGGQGYRWLDKVRLQMHRAAVAGSPVRSGEIKASHRSFISGINQWACRAEIANDADHADYVHEGTLSRPPRPVDGPYMRVPIAPGATRRFNARAVRGQAPNPWLDRACASVARRHGGIPVG